MKKDLSKDNFLSRTFNRRMKMKDTFTNILPTYGHVKKTCMVPPASHRQHPGYVKDILGRHVKDIPRTYNHKMDAIKDYSEEMYKLGIFAPQPVKGA